MKNCSFSEDLPSVSSSFLIRNIRKGSKKFVDPSKRTLNFQRIRTIGIRSAGLRPFFTIEASIVHSWSDSQNLNEFNSTVILESSVAIVNEKGDVKVFPSFFFTTPACKDSENQLRQSPSFFQSLTLRQFCCSHKEIKSAKKVYLCIKATKFVRQSEDSQKSGHRTRRAAVAVVDKDEILKREDFVEKHLYGCRELTTNSKENLNLLKGVHNVLLQEDGSSGFSMTDMNWRNDKTLMAKFEDQNVKLRKADSILPRVVFSMVDDRVCGTKKRKEKTRTSPKKQTKKDPIPFFNRKFGSGKKLEAAIKEVFPGYQASKKRKTSFDGPPPKVPKLEEIDNVIRTRSPLIPSKVIKLGKGTIPDQTTLNFRLPQYIIREGPLYQTGQYAIPLNDPTFITYHVENIQKPFLNDFRLEYNRLFRWSSSESGAHIGNKSQKCRFELMKRFLTENLEAIRGPMSSLFISHSLHMLESKAIDREQARELSQILAGSAYQPIMPESTKMTVAKPPKTKSKRILTDK